MAKEIHIDADEFLNFQKKNIEENVNNVDTLFFDEACIKKYIKDNDFYVCIIENFRYYIKNKVFHRDDGPAVLENGHKEWWENGKLHRENGPAIERSNGDKEWYFMGELHRIDGPAIISKYLGKKWYINGELHRIDGPAVEWSDGDKKWYQNGKLHRLDGPAIIYYEDNKIGEEYWYYHGKPHRIDGPAEIYYTDGKIVGKIWCQNGKPHRIDGPAVEFSDREDYRDESNDISGYGFKFRYPEMKNYFIEDVEYEKEEWEPIAKIFRKNKNKLVNKYARRWYEKCDKPDTIIWKNRIEKGWEEVEELYVKK